MTTAAILGLGNRGQAWAALLVGAGWRVHLFDPIPGLGTATAARLADGAPGPPPTACATISASVAGADWIADCVPDRVLLKRKLYELAQRQADPQTILASSATAFETETLRAAAPQPGQVLIARLEPRRGRVRLVSAPGVGTGLLAFADRLLRQSGIAVQHEPERGPERPRPPRARVVRLGATQTGPSSNQPAGGGGSRRPAQHGNRPLSRG